MLSTQAWNAFLKTVEEPPKYTVFIFCTTDPQKIPETIQNRCMHFRFTRVPSTLIEQKLDYICRMETEQGNCINNWNDTINYISRVCDGEVRKAISMLETCISYNPNFTLESSLQALGHLSYDRYFDLINYIIDGNTRSVFEEIEYLHDSGSDLKKFVDLFTEFCLDVLKYILCRNIQLTKFPVHLEDKLNFSIGFDNSEQYYLYVVDKLLDLRNMVKSDVNAKTTVEIVFAQMCRLS